MVNNATTGELILMGSSLLFSVGAFTYAYFTNTKRYELSSGYRAEILKWYSETLLILKKAKTAASEKDKKAICELSDELSAKIDVGRFYFPNSQRGDGKGERNPSAYQGYRNVVLDTLVHFHFVLNNGSNDEQGHYLNQLTRIYTSQVFDQLNPRKFIKQTNKHTNESFYSEKVIDENLQEIIAYIEKQQKLLKEHQLN